MITLRITARSSQTSEVETLWPDDAAILHAPAALSVPRGASPGVGAAVIGRRTQASPRGAIGEPSDDLAFQEIIRQGPGCTRQPAINKCLVKCFRRDLPQLNENSGVTVEVRDCEEASPALGQDSLLLAEILDMNGEDRSVRRNRVAESLQVSLAEGSFPRECLAGH